MAQQSGMKSYVSGVALLTLAMLFVKVLSMVYRIPFQNLVGDEGFYIYQQVYPFVAFFVTWTASGLAIAVSRILAESPHTSKTLIPIIFRYLSVVGIVLFILLFSFSSLFAEMMGDLQLMPLLRIGSFVALTIPFLAVYKGIAQKNGDMKTLATSQVVEQTVRVFLILCSAYALVYWHQSLYTVGAFATYATVLGEVVGILWLIWYVQNKQTTDQKQRLPRKEKLHIVKRLTIYSIGISLSSLLLILFQLVDSFTVFEQLKDSGMAIIEAMETKGIYDRGQPLVQVGLVLASSLAMAVVPLITIEMKRRRVREAEKYMRLTFNVSVMIGVAATAGLIAVMPYMNTMMFKTDVLSGVLSLFVVQIVWLSIIMPMMAVLQGLGYTKHPSLLLIAGLIVKLLCNELFVASFGIIGAAVASNLGLALSAIGLLLFLKKVTTVQFLQKSFVIGLSIATVGMLISVGIWEMLSIYATNQLGMHERWQATIVALSGVGIGAFVFLLIATKREVLSVRDWFVLPFGRKVAAFQLYVNRNKK
ncbi:putative polysaccharide biosynthesis protein [Kurthia senegalensis]|uniref:putative polysaccharide biosynthesis protein n=1 Tax=Kurthia senegalensis TaxID=1033740 RepID=UPI000287E68B|nr:polysaccharide biosynthesis protein [Kurthia senegalensis]